MKLRNLSRNNDASAIPLILYVLTIFVCGALYSLFFLGVAYPIFGPMIPASDSKVFIMMVMYAIPLIVMVVGVICVIKEGLKRTVGYVQ